MGCACRSPPILFGMKSKTEGNTLEFPLSARVSLLERNLKNGILFRLLPLKHSAVPPFSLEALMCKETIHNHLDSAILLIKYHPILWENHQVQAVYLLPNVKKLRFELFFCLLVFFYLFFNWLHSRNFFILNVHFLLAKYIRSVLSLLCSSIISLFNIE